MLVGMYNVHGGDLVLLSGKVVLLLGIVRDGEDVYWVGKTSDNNFCLTSALNLFIPLKERILENEYSYLERQIGFDVFFTEQERETLLINLLNENYEIIKFL